MSQQLRKHAQTTAFDETHWASLLTELFRGTPNIALHSSLPPERGLARALDEDGWRQTSLGDASSGLALDATALVDVDAHAISRIALRPFVLAVGRSSSDFSQSMLTLQRAFPHVAAFGAGVLDAVCFAPLDGPPSNILFDDTQASADSLLPQSFCLIGSQKELRKLPVTIRSRGFRSLESHVVAPPAESRDPDSVNSEQVQREQDEKENALRREVGDLKQRLEAARVEVEQSKLQLDQQNERSTRKIDELNALRESAREAGAEILRASNESRSLESKLQEAAKEILKLRKQNESSESFAHDLIARLQFETTRNPHSKRSQEAGTAASDGQSTGRQALQKAEADRVELQYALDEARREVRRLRKDGASNGVWIAELLGRAMRTQRPVAATATASVRAQQVQPASTQGVHPSLVSRLLRELSREKASSQSLRNRSQASREQESDTQQKLVQLLQRVRTFETELEGVRSDRERFQRFGDRARAALRSVRSEVDRIRELLAQSSDGDA